MKRRLAIVCLVAGCSAPLPSGPVVNPGWSSPVAGVAAPVVRDGRVYVRGYHALDALTGKTVSNTTGLVDEKSERIVASERPQLERSSASESCWDGFYYCFDKESNLVAYDLKHKRAAWKRPFAQSPYDRRVQAEPMGLQGGTSAVQAYKLPAGP